MATKDKQTLIVMAVFEIYEIYLDISESSILAVNDRKVHQQWAHLIYITLSAELKSGEVQTTFSDFSTRQWTQVIISDL